MLQSHICIPKKTKVIKNLTLKNKVNNETKLEADYSKSMKLPPTHYTAKVISSLIQIKNTSIAIIFSYLHLTSTNQPLMLNHEIHVYI